MQSSTYTVQCRARAKQSINLDAHIHDVSTILHQLHVACRVVCMLHLLHAAVFLASSAVCGRFSKRIYVNVKANLHCNA